MFFSVMIVSYETLRTLTAHLANCSIGLLLCDEGHRLKNSGELTRSRNLMGALWIMCLVSGNQTFQALNSLNVKRRVILTGTPVQNDLSEYFSLLNFANPNFLGSRDDFRKNFENAIIRGRDASASAEVQAQCEKKLKELGGLVTKFIIRRTNDLLSKYRESVLLRCCDFTTIIIQYRSSTSTSCSVDFLTFSLPCTAFSYPHLRSKRYFAVQSPSHSRQSISSRSFATILNYSTFPPTSMVPKSFYPKVMVAQAPQRAIKARTRRYDVIGEENSWSSSGSCIASRQLPMIKLCSLAITRRHLTYSRSCVEARSESMFDGAFSSC